MSRPGQDLRLPAGPGLPSGTTIPAAELVERFSRSPGPGGQSVNTSDSRVELVFAPASSTGFTDAQRTRLVTNLAGRTTGDGAVSVVASEHRSQLRNRIAARERLVELLQEALAPTPPPRRRTGPSRAARRRRVEGKKRRGRTKALRGRIQAD
ncbi:alternative ribosome rescue aminoacyl-tRNA hydrolase ArfB [Nocardioides sp. TF02-7]|uniref:alternative ribosome rescue aminoacyl-tRNA hydrolase ArfB n=1 Tax=Nocardioides sp. TF02-7 TaxID=2917724 RepID=UPI001F0627D2|nr:alternative ribosome rescue aminoacyl-tRNA hydrolase ArfB [Nocardioides sp. TF02-7]UMG93673.1 aminoacyl-tRNA hydrolase [Nocardioides sp. TF02-7]